MVSHNYHGWKEWVLLSYLLKCEPDPRLTFAHDGLATNAKIDVNWPKKTPKSWSSLTWNSKNQMKWYGAHESHRRQHRWYDQFARDLRDLCENQAWSTMSMHRLGQHVLSPALSHATLQPCYHNGSGYGSTHVLATAKLLLLKSAVRILLSMLSWRVNASAPHFEYTYLRFVLREREGKLEKIAVPIFHDSFNHSVYLHHT
jgi:hypothetical protein